MDHCFHCIVLLFIRFVVCCQYRVISQFTLAFYECRFPSSSLISLHHFIFFDTTSHHITSRHITPHHVTSRHIISHHIISYHIISYHIISYHIISYHITSYHITSHHIISHHITSHLITSHLVPYYDRTICGHVHQQCVSF
jgi:hypothetical protein